MKGDIFNNSTGDVFAYCCMNASGDLIPQTSSCALETPYTMERMNFLRNEVSRTKGLLEMAKAKFSDLNTRFTRCQANLGFRCRKKYGGSLSELRNWYHQAKTEKTTAENAYSLAVSNLEQAEKANKEATALFDACKVDETKRLEMEQEKLRILAETGNLPAPATTETETTGNKLMALAGDNPNRLYAMIGLGIAVIGFIAYKKLRK